MFNKWKIEADVQDALVPFMQRLEREQLERLVADGLDCPANIDNARVSYSKGRKFAKIMVGSGVRYFVRLADGYIYASASRNTPNFKRSFGSLWTVEDFDWGEYEARAKPGTPWIMVETANGYMTAVPA